MPGISYSIGSSTVRILRSRELIWLIPAYKVVLLPEPVGPVTKIMPWGLLIKSENKARFSAVIPKSSRFKRALFLSSKRSTTRSPKLDGIVDTRTSTARPAIRKLIRPSCGIRFSAISSLAITLIRDTSNDASLRLGLSTSLSTPSTLKRITSSCSKVSI